MLFGNLVNPDFAAKVQAICNDLNINADSLMACMGFETGYTYNPSIQNSIGATGLIQFMPDTAKGLGTTTDALKAMTAIDQLDYVKAYFANVAMKYGTPKTLGDMYLCMFYPAAIPQSDDYKFPTYVYNANKGFDTTGRGYILKSDVSQFIATKTAIKGGQEASAIVGNATLSGNDPWQSVVPSVITPIQLYTIENRNFLVLSIGGVIILAVIISLVYILIKK